MITVQVSTPPSASTVALIAVTMISVQIAQRLEAARPTDETETHLLSVNVQCDDTCM